MEVEAELVHRCRKRPHRPPRPGTFPRQAHGCHDRRGEEQPRAHAIAATARDRCDPKSGESLSGSYGSSVSATLLAPRMPARLNLAHESGPPPILTTSAEARMKVVVSGERNEKSHHHRRT